jgi:V/A-type H+-transporting ATPase subunit D
MEGLRLNKSELKRQRDQLKLYQRVLPSLDLKRRQLAIENERCRALEATLRSELDALMGGIGAAIPMLANESIDLLGLVRVVAVELGSENVVGLELPTLARLELADATYSYLVRPVWVDAVADRLHEAVRLTLELTVAAERLKRVEYALKRITQRVNLFERVLIPNAKSNIRRIEIALDDLAREAVVRSKIAKSRFGREARGGGA